MERELAEVGGDWVRGKCAGRERFDLDKACQGVDHGLSCLVQVEEEAEARDPNLKL